MSKVQMSSTRSSLGLFQMTQSVAGLTPSSLLSFSGDGAERTAKDRQMPSAFFFIQMIYITLNIRCEHTKVFFVFTSPLRPASRHF